ncbi:glutamate--cysteine ligase [Amycolatopsis coloradensis]|uniref:Putative glutamate--cysteine ligase 2 n=1 Tax=Amycolatopsis coloradensis TaxID=76021 RepID=A0A1R0KFM5_9PSEU|nr:glutamate--cysteine ligase [Amycolatopsis coloradensis]OLZ44163.1 glutamate--cysteine ligase [Amycolatopsis coloradensis]
MTRSGESTVGVEEEYLVVDPRSRQVRPAAAVVIDGAAGRLGERVGTELTRFQLEVRTEPHTRVDDLGEQLREMRAVIADAAADHGLCVVSSGSPVLGDAVPPPITDGHRYAASAAHFRALDDEQVVCACHVHIGLADRALALRVSNHLRPWLPVLVALSANSPYWAGRDTGYASWRTMTWARWPAAGPPPYFRSSAHFDVLVDRLLETGVIMDRAGVYWDVRPSSHLPTLEVRVTDAATTVAETQLFTALIRALADTALADIAAGAPDPDPDPHTLRAAHWRAARDGLSGHAVHPRTGCLLPATTLTAELLAHVKAAVHRNGDHQLVDTQWRRLHHSGTGADRQRAACGGHGRLSDVVDHLAHSYRG